MRATRGTGLLENFLSSKRAQKAEDLIPSHLKRGRVLDVGCGTRPLFLARSSFTEKHGIDSSIDLSYAKKHGIEAVKRNIEGRLPFRDNHFDAVTMLAVLEHFELDAAKSALSEARRVLKMGGMLVVTTPSPRSGGLLGIMSRIGLVSPEEISEHKTLLSRTTLISLLGDCGFDKAKISTGSFELGANLYATATK